MLTVQKYIFLSPIKTDRLPKQINNVRKTYFKQLYINHSYLSNHSISLRTLLKGLH